jgi:hypothetical protein
MATNVRGPTSIGSSESSLSSVTEPRGSAPHHHEASIRLAAYGGSAGDTPSKVQYRKSSSDTGVNMPDLMSRSVMCGSFVSLCDVGQVVDETARMANGVGGVGKDQVRVAEVLGDAQCAEDQVVVGFDA